MYQPYAQPTTIFAVIQHDTKPSGQECYYVIPSPDPGVRSRTGHLIDNEDSDPLWPAIKKYAYTYPDEPTHRVQVTYVLVEGYMPSVIITAIGLA